MGFRDAMRMGREMAEMKAKFPEAWAAGQEMAREALRTRSGDLIAMLSADKSRRDFYSRTVAESAVGMFQEAVESGELELPYTLTAECLAAVGIACGTLITDELDREATR